MDVVQTRRCSPLRPLIFLAMASTPRLLSRNHASLCAQSRRPRSYGGRRMFISIRRYSSVRSVNEVCQKIRSGFVPLLQGSPGFIAYYAIDAGNGTMATISMFSMQEMALESNEKAARWLQENVADLQPEPAEITSGEVKVRVEAK
jgi:hypothetical protein